MATLTFDESTHHPKVQSEEPGQKSKIAFCENS